MNRSNHSHTSSQAEPQVRSESEDELWLTGEFRKCESELFGTLFYLLGNREDATDAIQDTFLRCWKHRSDFAKIQNSKAWIFRIAINIGKDIRKNAWNRKKKDMVEDDTLLPSLERSPGELAVEKEQIQQLQNAIQKLEEDEKNVFLLRQNGDMTYEQIAEYLDIPTGTVKTRMKRAIEKLRKELK